MVYILNSCIHVSGSVFLFVRVLECALEKYLFVMVTPQYLSVSEIKSILTHGGLVTPYDAEISVKIFACNTS